MSPYSLCRGEYSNAFLPVIHEPGWVGFGIYELSDTFSFLFPSFLCYNFDVEDLPSSPPPPLSGSRLFSSWPLFVPRDEKMIKGKKIKKGERSHSVVIFPKILSLRCEKMSDEVERCRISWLRFTTIGCITSYVS